MENRQLDPAHGTNLDLPETDLVKKAFEIWLNETSEQFPLPSTSFDLLEFGPILRWCMVISVGDNLPSDDFRYSFCGPGAVDFTGVDPTGVAIGEFPNEKLRTKWIGIFDSFMQDPNQPFFFQTDFRSEGRGFVRAECAFLPLANDKVDSVIVVVNPLQQGLPTSAMS